MDEFATFKSRWSLERLSEFSPSDGLTQTRLTGETTPAKLDAPIFGETSPLDIVGQYSAFIVVTYVSSTIAERCLPRGLELAPPPGTPAGKHPVMYSFGSHYHVHPRFFKLWHYDYAEALVGLCNVKFRHADGSYSGPYFHMTSVRLNNAFADEIGVALGFPKRLAQFEITDTTYSFRVHGDSSPVMSGTFLISGDVFDSNFPNFKTISPFMQQPVISKSPSGTFLLTPFHIDTQTAFMMPMKAAIHVSDQSLAGLPMGQYDFKGIDTTAFGGGYYSYHNWRMSTPTAIGS
jgi:hypothetical protein